MRAYYANGKVDQWLLLFSLADHIKQSSARIDQGCVTNHLENKFEPLGGCRLHLE